MLDKLLHHIERTLFDLKSAAPHVGERVIGLLRYPYALAHDIARGELTLRAMSLVYSTLLSIVPLLALVFSVLKGLGYHRTLEPVLAQFLQPMGEKGQQLTVQIMHFVDNARGDVLGTLGVAFFLYTAVSMIQKVESSFNMVWRVQEPRSIGRRISEYLSVLMVGPILIVTALGLMATLASNSLVQSIAQLEPFGTLLLWFGRATPYMLVICVFTFLYTFVPNTKVSFKAALVGGIFAGSAWVGGGVLFASYVGGTSTTVLIYAGFAIVILALIWLHISWLILLMGAQLAFYVQHPQCLRPGTATEQLSAGASERLALSIMYLLARDFAGKNAGQHHAKHYTLNDLAQRLYIAVTTLAPIVRRLESAGLVLATDTDRLVPGRDLENIALIDILDAVRHDRGEHTLRHVHSVAAADAVARDTENAMRRSLDARTLKDLIGTESEPKQPSATGD